MIPDKIYIPLYPNHSLDGVHLGDDWMYEPHKECDNIEYINKNTLIEMLDEMLESKPDVDEPSVHVATLILNEIKKTINSI